MGATLYSASLEQGGYDADVVASGRRNLSRTSAR